MEFELIPVPDPSVVRANVYFLDASGQVVLLIEEMECIASAALNRLGGTAEKSGGGASRLIDDATSSAARARAGLEPIAIIGMACLFPQAPDLASFWRNIVSGVDAVGEPAAAWDAERYLRVRAHQDRVRRLSQGPVPLRSARVRDHAELARRRRARSVRRLAHRPRRARRCRLPERPRPPRHRHRPRPQHLPASRPGRDPAEHAGARPDDGAARLGVPFARGRPAREHPRADAEQAAAEQRRHRAGARAQRHDRPHRQPAQPARARTTCSTPPARRRCWR